MPDDIHSVKRVLGFDFGHKHIGVAIGEVFTATAKPLTTITARHGEPNWDDIHHLIERWSPEALVVGIPINMDGTDGTVTNSAKNFAKNLSEKCLLPVIEIDERLTTVEAKQQLFEKGGFDTLDKATIDAYSAKLIVESWLSDLTREEL